MTKHEWDSCDDPVVMWAFINGLTLGAEQPTYDWLRRKTMLTACAICRRRVHESQDEGSAGMIEWAEERADGRENRQERWKMWFESPYKYGQGIERLYMHLIHHRLSEIEILGRIFRYDLSRTNSKGWEVSERTSVCQLFRDIFGPIHEPLSLPKELITSDIIGLAGVCYAERPPQKCGGCNGRGAIRWAHAGGYEKVECSPCKGTGEIPTGQLRFENLLILADALEDRMESLGYSYTEECQACGGSGYGLGAGPDRGNPECGLCVRGKVKRTHPLLTYLRRNDKEYLHYRGDWAVDLCLGIGNFGTEWV